MKDDDDDDDDDVQPDPLVVVPVAEKITPISIHSKRTNKKYFSDAMDTEEEDTAQIPKNQKVEQEDKMVKATEGKGKKKHMKVKGPAFEIKECPFSDTPKDSTSQFKTMVELFDRYRDDKDTTTNGSLKLYADVRKISRKDVSLVTVRDHNQNTLNLAIATKNKVVEMRMNI